MLEQKCIKVKDWVFNYEEKKLLFCFDYRFDLIDSIDLKIDFLICGQTVHFKAKLYKS